MEMEMKREEMRQITSLTRQCKVIKAILLADGGESFTNKTLEQKSNPVSNGSMSSGTSRLIECPVCN